MQKPTLTDVHIRTVDDAHKLFYAVQLGLLPKIEKRLDAHERAALRPGNVYVWEEKAPSADNYTVTMERFTEGKSWTASRVRDDFLMYYESDKKKKGDRDDAPQRARSLENQVVRNGERDLYIKLTYSVYRTEIEDPASPSGSADKDKDRKKPRKWHLNAYFTKFTEGQLRTIDDIQMLRSLVVPDGLYKTARSTTKSAKKSGEAGKAVSSTIQRTYAPFPSSHPRMRQQQQSQILPAESPQGDVKMDISVGDSSVPVSQQQQQAFRNAASLPPIVNPPHPAQIPSPKEPYALQQNATPFSPQFYPSQSGSSPAERQMHQQQPSPYIDPSSGVFSARTMPGSGSGSSDTFLSSPLMSDFSHGSWSSHASLPPLNYLLAPLTYAPQPMHPQLNRPCYHHSLPHLPDFNSHTPSLSESSHSSSSPYSRSRSLSMSIDGEEDLSAYVPAPPPLFNESDSDGHVSGYRAVENNSGDPNVAGCERVALAPLQSLRRNHPYRRCSADDRALRMLGPGAR